MIRLDQGDNRESLRAMIRRGEFVQSVVTDPPYGLVSVNKRFGSQDAKPAQYGIDGLFARQSRGFMGKIWDGSGIERDPEFWRLVYDVMLPGAYLLAFSSTRTYHHMAVAIEQAGFITHPLLIWTASTGFPKGHDAARSIDRELGVQGTFGDPKSAAHAGWQRPRMADEEAVSNNARQYIGGCDAAQQWDGWKYGTQSLKPALEPIYMGQKPFSEKNGALNLLKHGVGAVNIDGCRVATDETITATRNIAMGSSGSGVFGVADKPGVYAQQPGGRYPANLLHDNSPEVVALFPDTGKAGVAVQRNRDGGVHNEIYGAYAKPSAEDVGYGDSGSAARFFNSFPHEGPLLHYPKAGKKDRAGSKHATVKPVALMRHLVRLVTPLGGTVLDPFAGSGTTAQACLDEGMSCVMMEAEQEYIGDICRRFDLDPGLRNKIARLSQTISELCDAANT